MPIKDYSTTPAANISLFPEGMNPADINNGMRQVQADLATDYISREFRPASQTPTRTGANTFTVPGDFTTTYVTGRRIRLTDTGSNLFGTIAGSVYNAPNTTVTVTLDSGTLTSNLTATALGFDPTNKPIPGAAIRGFDNPTFQTSTVTGNSIAAAFIPTGAAVPADGLYRPAADTVALATASTERVRIDSAGNVGIGVAASGNQGRLQVSGGIGMSLQDRLYLYWISNVNTAYFETTSNGDVRLITGLTAPASRMFISNTGDAIFSNSVTAPGFVPTAAAGSVGSSGLMRTAVSATFGEIISGANLQPTNTANSIVGATQTGSWRCYGAANAGQATSFQRIA